MIVYVGLKGIFFQALNNYFMSLLFTVIGRSETCPNEGIMSVSHRVISKRFCPFECNV